MAKATFSKFAEAQSPCSGDAKHKQEFEIYNLSVFKNKKQVDGI